MPIVRRHVQWRRTAVHLQVADLAPLITQHTDRVVLALLGREVDSRGAVVPCRQDIGPFREQDPDHVGVAHPRRDLQSGPVVVGDSIHVSLLAPVGRQILEGLVHAAQIVLPYGRMKLDLLRCRTSRTSERGVEE